MNQQTFDTATAGSGAIYVPYMGKQPHYELMSIAVVIGNVNNRIRVTVQDEFGVWVRHEFGTDHERFVYAGEPVQFNLGGGSHYTQPDDPPNHIMIEGLPSDVVHVGNANIAGFQHTDWQMVFKKIYTVTPPVPMPPVAAPGVTEAQVKRWINEAFEQAKFK